MYAKSEFYVQGDCSCGGELIVVVTIPDSILQTTRDEDRHLLVYEELLKFKHDGIFTESCLVFKDEMVENLKKDMVTRFEDVLLPYVSRNLHGL